MKQEAFSQFAYPELVLIAFIMFFISFVGLTLLTYRRSQRSVFKLYSTIPLNEGHPNE